MINRPLEVTCALTVVNIVSVTCLLLWDRVLLFGAYLSGCRIGGNVLSSVDSCDSMDDLKLEQHRWVRLLRWLGEEHGMDVGEDAFHVEAREVPGMLFVTNQVGGKLRW